MAHRIITAILVLGTILYGLGVPYHLHVVFDHDCGHHHGARAGSAAELVTQFAPEQPRCCVHHPDAEEQDAEVDARSILIDHDLPGGSDGASTASKSGSCESGPSERDPAPHDHECPVCEMIVTSAAMTLPAVHATFAVHGGQPPILFAPADLLPRSREHSVGGPRAPPIA